MTHFLAYAEIRLDANAFFEALFTKPADAAIGYIVELDLKYPDAIKQKPKYFPFHPESKILDVSHFIE